MAAGRVAVAAVGPKEFIADVHHRMYKLVDYCSGGMFSWTWPRTAWQISQLLKMNLPSADLCLSSVVDASIAIFSYVY